jgi:hypothetical protein
MSPHARDARDSVLLLLAGLLGLTLLAAATYRPHGPRWPHTVVNGGAWLLLVTCATVLCVSGVRSVTARLRRI